MLLKPIALLMLSFLVTCVIGQGQSKDTVPGSIVSSYDRFEDMTITQVSSMIVAGEGYEELSIGVLFVFPGKEMKELPDHVTLMVWSTVKGYRFMSDTTLILVADALRFPLGRMEVFTRQEVVEGMVQLERLRIGLTAADFAKIAYSKSVVGRLGTMEFIFTDQQLKSLRSLAALTGVPAKKRRLNSRISSCQCMRASDLIA